MKSYIKKLFSIIMCFVFIVTNLSFMFEARAETTQTQYVFPQYICKSGDDATYKRTVLYIDIYPNAYNYNKVNLINSESVFRFYNYDLENNSFLIDDKIIYRGNEAVVTGGYSSINSLQPKRIEVPIYLPKNVSLGIKAVEIFNKTGTESIYRIDNAFTVTNNDPYDNKDFYIDKISSSSVVLKWESEELEVYSAVYKMSNQGEAILAGDITNDNQFIDNTIQQGQEYYYMVKHFLNDGNVKNSSLLKVKPAPNLILNNYVDILSGNTNKLNWNAQQETGVTYYVYKQINSLDSMPSEQLLYSGTNLEYVDSYGIPNEIAKYKLSSQILPNPTVTPVPPIISFRQEYENQLIANGQPLDGPQGVREERGNTLILNGSSNQAEATNNTWTREIVYSSLVGGSMLLDNESTIPKGAKIISAVTGSYSVTKSPDGNIIYRETYNITIPVATVTPTVTPTQASRPSASSSITNVNTNITNTIEILEQKIDAISKEITSETSADTIVKKNEQVLQDISRNTENKEQLKDKINQMAQVSVNVAGVEKIQSRVENGTAKIEITEERVYLLEKKADKVNETTEKITQSFNKYGVELTQKIERKVTLDIQTSNSDKIETTLPANVFEKLDKKGINKLEIDAKVAKVALDTKSLILTGDEKVALEIKKVSENNKPMVKTNIAEPKGEIYQFDVSVVNPQGQTKKVTKFQKDVRLTIPYQLNKNDDPNTLSVYLFVEDIDHLEDPKDIAKLNTWQSVGGKYNSDSQSMIVNRKTFSMYTIMHLNKSFGDIAKCEWARKEIEMMAAKGFINGKQSNRFAPMDNVTRAEFTAFLVRTLGLLDKNAKANFSDIKENDWYYPAIASAYELGIVSGKGNNKFLPNEYITRQEMMLMASNAVEKVVGVNIPKDSNIQVALNGYNDSSNVAEWAKKAVGFAVVKGIIKGGQDNRLNPTKHATRAETVVMLKRIYDLI